MNKKAYLDNQEFFKPNYYKALEFITPRFLKEDERVEFGQTVDLKDQIINKMIDACNSFSSILPVSGYANSSFSSITSFSGIAPYFVKQNQLTEITPSFFDLKVLGRVGQSLANFKTEDDLRDYLEDTLLPSISLNNPTSYFRNGESLSATHNYLIQNLSWMYFLNTSGASYSPSSYVLDTLTEKLTLGQPITTNDGVKGFVEHLWKNGYTSYYPSSFASSTGTYTSGTQGLEKLQTWVDVIWSPLYADSGDFTVKDRFDLYLEARAKIEDKVVDGPFQKLLRAVSFLAYDINDDTERLGSLHDIESCPDEYLPYLAEMIGWNLFGSNPERWRLQLANAVEVYKRVGTKKSLQFALNTVFPKDQFSIESRVTELWESYIPYLIYYSLATESEYFRSRATWTRQVASQLKVVGYSNTSLDENIKLAVDKILLDTYQRFRNRFNIPNARNEFNYRGRRFPIPPFEEYPYYVNVELDEEMLLFIADRLVCFGVSNDFALEVVDYVTGIIESNDDEIRNTSWLLFTSGYNEPPNLSGVVSDLNNKKFEYVSLWSGKSSHFKLTFDASEFDFSNLDESDFSSGEAVGIASKIVNEFSPAHSIPLINLQLSSIDVMSFESNNLPIVDLQKEEVGENVRIMSNIYASGFTTSGTTATNIPRNSLRRRSYEKTLPKDGYYDMTGFNQPVAWDLEATASGIVLGFIPSSLKFETVSSVSSIPLVYQSCQGLSSNTFVYGYYVSNTIPCLGNTGIVDGSDNFCDLGQTPPIYLLMHELGRAREFYETSSTYYTSGNVSSSNWFNHLESKLNEVSVFPSDYSDYSNFSFGSNLHKLYQIYTKEFSRHRLSEDLHTKDGANIFSHTFGPILFNHDFDLVNTQYVTSSILSPITLFSTSSIFSVSDTQFSLIPSIFTSSIVSGVDLVHTSGSFYGNSFAVVKVPVEDRDSYVNDKTFIVLNSNNGFTRVRFDLTRDFGLDSTYPVSSNFFLPDHKFEVKLKHIITDRLLKETGGRSVGVWIHTKNEGSKIWSFINGGWVQHSTEISVADVFNTYANIFNITRETKEDLSNDASGNSRFRCLSLIQNQGSTANPVTSLVEADLQELSLEFNTCNNSLLPDYSYQNSYGQVHRKNQNYVIEVFLLPSTSDDKVMVLDSVSVTDLTMNGMSKFVALDVCPQILVDLGSEGIQTLFRFWNDISGKNSTFGLASRDSNESSTIMYSNGGSRLDYRRSSSWETLVKVSNSTIYTVEFTL